MNSLLKFLVLGVSFLTALNAAQTELFKLQLDAPESGDRFGEQVTLSGHRAVISAPGANGGVGRVYVYDLLTQERLFELKPSELSGDYLFGYAMAASEKYVLASARNRSGPDSSFRLGNAYLFDLATGEELFQFPQKSPTRYLYIGVDVSEDYALVSYTPAVPFSGSSVPAELDVYDTKTGEHIRTLTTDVANSGGNSTSPLFSINEGKVLVARGEDGFGSFATIFDIASGDELVGWVFPSRFRAGAVSVDFNQGFAAVGFTDDTITNTGVIQIYDPNTGNLIREVSGNDPGLISNAGARPRIGHDLSISGSNLVSGAVNSSSGYLIDLSDEGNESIELTTLNKQLLSEFGNSVATSGNFVLVGEPGRDKTSELYDTGAAYVFDVDAPPDSGSGELTNISTRGTVLNGDGIMVGGFVIDEDARRVLIRGLGPTLGEFGVAGALSDSQMIVFRQGGGVVASNDNWGDQSNADTIAAVSATVGAFPLAEDSLDAVLLLDLAPGAYTVHLKGIGDATGVGLIEVYRVP